MKISNLYNKKENISEKIVNELLDFYLQIGNEWFRFGLDSLRTIITK